MNLAGYVQVTCENVAGNAQVTRQAYKQGRFEGNTYRHIGALLPFSGLVGRRLICGCGGLVGLVGGRLVCGCT